MEEPEALHPFSSNFRSQLSEVLSKPAMVSKIKHIPVEKQFLETEIDSYSGVQFENASVKSPAKRQPTPPIPTHRTFTFDKANPFSKNVSETSDLSLPRYAEVSKPKNKPKVPPKPLIRNDVGTTNTLPQAQKLPDKNAKVTEGDYFYRVNSLPNLTPEIVQNKNIRASGNFLLLQESLNSSTPGYGHLNKMRQCNDSSASLYHMARSDDANGASDHDVALTGVDYCDVISDSPAYIDDYTIASRTVNRYENIYEDVNTKVNTGQMKLQPVDGKEGSDSDYTLMCSPVSEIRFTFGRQALYENCEVIHSPDSQVCYQNEDEIGEAKSHLGDPNNVGLPEPVSIEAQVSPTSSFDDHDSSVYSVQSSMASTTASSFQRMQVCFFPPSPPPEFRIGNIDRPESVTSGSSTRSRTSRSRIPVPIKPKRQDPANKLDDSDQQPPTPKPSPVVRTKNNPKNNKQIVLSPPSPPGNELVPAGRRLGSAGKGAKWYEKLGCIQTGTIQPSEPYGQPGERKRSKSLNREPRKSQFFLPVEPNSSTPPSLHQPMQG